MTAPHMSPSGFCCCCWLWPSVAEWDGLLGQDSLTHHWSYYLLYTLPALPLILSMLYRVGSHYFVLLCLWVWPLANDSQGPPLLPLKVEAVLEKAYISSARSGALPNSQNTVLTLLQGQWWVPVYTKSIHMGLPNGRKEKCLPCHLEITSLNP